MMDVSRDKFVVYYFRRKKAQKERDLYANEKFTAIFMKMCESLMLNHGMPLETTIKGAYGFIAKSKENNVNSTYSAMPS